MSMHRSPHGFTLVELILVIIVLGIISTVSTKYLGLGAQMYAQSSDRERLLSQSRFAIERLVRELRNAVPNSVRVNKGLLTIVDDCIEFMPLLNAGRYTSIPLLPESAGSITIYSSLSDWQVQTGHYLIVYPTAPEHIYNTTNQRIVQLTGVTRNINELTFSFNAHSFPAASPSNRLYLARSPVSYCMVDDKLWRYSNYSLDAVQPSAAAVAANGVLMAEGLNQPADLLDAAIILPPFEYDEPELSRNSVVHIFLSFSSNFSDNLFFNQEVHIPNVP